MSPVPITGHLDLLLLALVGEGPKHGYAVLAALQERSEGAIDVRTGTVYQALGRLEQDGLLSSHWTVVLRRRRRTYEMTAAGREHLVERRDAWSRFTSAVGAVIGMVP